MDKAEQPTITQALDDLLEKRAKLVDDVRYYSGNEEAGYAEIAALDGEIVKHIIAHRTTSLAAQGFQQRVEPWFRECFPPTVCNDRLERGDRLLEEVLELLQSGDYPPERVAALVDYTWGRPKGEPVQEVGGVMVTLAAYCIAHGLDMGEAGEIELARINRPEIVQKIRAKQAAKPTGSALPIAPSPPAQDGLVEALREALAAAYVAGATDVHNAWVEGVNGGEPDFGEAGWDYAHSIDLSAIKEQHHD